MGATTLLVQRSTDIISRTKTPNEDSREGKKKKEKTKRKRQKNKTGLPNVDRKTFKTIRLGKIATKKSQQASPKSNPLVIGVADCDALGADTANQRKTHENVRPTNHTSSFVQFVARVSISRVKTGGAPDVALAC